MFETTRRPLAHSVSSLGKLRMQGAWKIELLHSAPRHRLYWITRGQGRISVNCITRGYGPNTAVFVPARAPMALELPSQTQGLELCLPPDDSLGLPEEPFHLRVSSLEAQGSLTSHLEKIERELAAQAPAMERALAAYSLLISVWMTRSWHGRRARSCANEATDWWSCSPNAWRRSSAPGAGSPTTPSSFRSRPPISAVSAGRPRAARPMRS
jgi:hypothetical protein